MLNKWKQVNGVKCMLDKILTGFMFFVNLVVIALVITCFFKPALTVYTVAIILCSYTLNEALVERRLRRIEEILEKSKNSM